MKKPFSIFIVMGLAIMILASTSINQISEYAACTFSAVEMPKQLQNGDPFPTDSTTIDGWVANSYAINGLETNPDIISHAWGLWQALTAETKQRCNGRQLRRLETWYTPQDIMKATAKGEALPAQISTGAFQARTKFQSFRGSANDNPVKTVTGDIVGRVKYNPAAANFANDNRLFDKEVMMSKTIAGGIAKINMPPNSVLLKPIYRVLSDNFKIYPGMYRFHIWSGRSDAAKQDADFEKFIYVCTNSNDPRIDDKSVFGIDDFIHHKMSEAEAIAYNETKAREGAEISDNPAKMGDYVILLGSHVSTRESVRWTWQSFFWSPNPDNPVFPSSATMAAGRKTVKGLDAPADHYAVTLGYSMLSPAAPNDLDLSKGMRTDNRGSVYALNPYIEGTFDTSVFANQKQIYDQHGLGSLFKPRNVDGITSSCMGCHSQAAFYTDVGTAAGTFIADQYVPRNAPWFIGKVQTDFAWSLSGVFEQPVSDFSGED